MNKIAEILESIASGIDPITGEVFEIELLREDPSIKQAIKKLRAVFLNKKSNSIYEKYEGLYPEHIIIMKEGYFYRSHNTSALIINRELGYKLREDLYGRLTTGGPDLDKITKALTKEDHSFIVVESREITQKYDGRVSLNDIEWNSERTIDISSLINRDDSEVLMINEQHEEQSNIITNGKISMNDVLLSLSSDEQISNFEFSIKNPIPISEIARRINVCKIDDQKEKLSYKKITSWLIKDGYLELVKTEDGVLRVRPTLKGNQVGIELEKRKGRRGEYQVVVYAYNAQKFIVDRLQDIYDYLSS